MSEFERNSDEKFKKTYQNIDGAGHKIPTDHDISEDYLRDPPDNLHDTHHAEKDGVTHDLQNKHRVEPGRWGPDYLESEQRAHGKKARVPPAEVLGDRRLDKDVRHAEDPETVDQFGNVRT